MPHRQRPGSHPTGLARIALVLWLTLVPGGALAQGAASAPSSDAPAGEAALAEGEAALHGGEFERSAARLEEAARLFRAAGRERSEGRALAGLADAQRGLGNYRAAVTSLQEALRIAEASGDAVRIAATRAALGKLYIAAAPTEAQRELEAAAALAAKADARALAASIHNDLGNHFAILSEGAPTPEASRALYQQAGTAYARALTEADQAADSALATRALANHARAAVDAADDASARALLGQARTRSKHLAPSHESVYTLNHIGRSFERLQARSAAADRDLLLPAHAVLTRAEEMAQGIGDTRGAAYSLGYLGALYEDEGRHEEALDLTRRALFQAQQARDDQSRTLWHTQAARLYRALGREDEAIEQYQAAIDILVDLRHTMAVSYGTGAGSFREGPGRVYFDLVDVLLRRASRQTDPTRAQDDLVLVQQTMERFKAAELRDYFQDECVDAYRDKVMSLEGASRSAVIVYPVPLDDRLELLVSGPSGIRQFTVDVTAEELDEEVARFRSLLEKRTTRQYLPHAQRLYALLVAPYADSLEGQGVETLVFVPDGSLRTIPPAALHDGERFLIERYSLAITPGLELTDPRPIDRENIRPFLAGLSESVQGFPPLEHVPGELGSIQEIYGGEVLLDESFLVKNVESQMLSREFGIVHIASHAEFGREVDDTYLLTHEGRITMDQLSDFVGVYRYRDRPLDLITLSACETAAGDERAALGLAGVAIKSGARSALGTLWKVNDLAASDLVVEFYRQLREPKVSRAQALQRAQMKMLGDIRYRHPGYWSPFLLISNWL